MPITNRYFERQVAFTDSVARFRFDGADETLVAYIVDRNDLSLSTQPAQSHFKAPGWWQLPESGIYYLRGAGHQYQMLVYDPATGRIFFERTQN